MWIINELGWVFGERRNIGVVRMSMILLVLFLFIVSLFDIGFECWIMDLNFYCYLFLIKF